MKNNTCVKCGENKSDIKKYGMLCGRVDYFGDLEAEYGRHRFKPYSEKELGQQAKEQKAIADNLGDMADFFNEIISCDCGWKDKRTNLDFDEKTHDFLCPKCKKIYEKSI